jgi:hypothetical protein
MKKIKNLAVLTLAFGALALSSCNKKDITPDTTPTLIATIDGAVTDFNVNAAALQGTLNGKTVTNIQGSTASGATLSINLNGTLTAGKTYSDAAANNIDMPIFVYSTSANSQNDYLNDDDNASNLPSVTITAVTPTTIDGTFKGLVGTIDGKSTKSITDGKFHVIIQTHP